MAKKKAEAIELPKESAIKATIQIKEEKPIPQSDDGYYHLMRLDKFGNEIGGIVRITPTTYNRTYAKLVAEKSFVLKKNP